MLHFRVGSSSSVWMCVGELYVSVGERDAREGLGATLIMDCM